MMIYHKDYGALAIFGRNSRDLHPVRHAESLGARNRGDASPFCLIFFLLSRKQVVVAYSRRAAAKGGKIDIRKRDVVAGREDELGGVRFALGQCLERSLFAFHVVAHLAASQISSLL